MTSPRLTFYKVYLQAAHVRSIKYICKPLLYKVYLQAASDIAMTELPPTHPIRWKLILWLSEEKSEYPFGEELLKVIELPLPQGFLPQAEIELYIQQNDEYNDNDAVFRNSILMLKAKYCSAFERELNGWLGVVQSLAALQYLSSKKSLALQYLSSKKSSIAVFVLQEKQEHWAQQTLPTWQLHQPAVWASNINSRDE